MEETNTQPLPKKKRWLKITGKILLSLLVIIICLYTGLAWYLHTHKKQVLQSVTTSLNDNISGALFISDMETTLLQGFPRIGLTLKNVTLRDSLYPTHKRTLLTAGTMQVDVNMFALFRGAVEIKKIRIADAAIDLFTSKEGYSNTAVFGKKKKTEKTASSGSTFPELKKLTLENVSFTADNRKTNKLYRFKVNSLKAALDYRSFGWEADVSLDGMAKSMAFNTGRGSFIKDKSLEGSFYITYNEKEGFLKFAKRTLSIGREDFVIGAKLGVGESSKFSITIQNKDILWKNAANLLSPNITEKLMMFDIAKPITVACDIVGDFNSTGDPLIQVNAIVKDNVLTTPGGDVETCSFFGVFTNNNIAGRGYDDINSAIKLFGFKGNYKGIPFLMKRVAIRNLEKPIAVGNLAADFKMEQLAGLVDDDLLKFSKGTASARFNFKADVVNFKLTKPLVNGSLAIKNANVTYVPRKLEFKDVSVALDFTQDNLNISQIVLKTGRSIVNMQGSIRNFLNLYYTAPEKIVLEWQMYSPQLHLGEFMAFLQTRKKTQKAIRQNTKGNFTGEMNELFEKCNVDMKLKVDKLYYKKFYATNATANVLLTDKGGIVLKDAGLKHAGGVLKINGALTTGGATHYNLKANVQNVEISKFLYAFDNFGLESLTSKNLKGLFSAEADVKGTITESGTLLPRSISGNVNFGLKKGQLVNFDPVVSVGKFAFPFRDVKNIEFYNLKGRFELMGEKVKVYPMKINSSLLNMDIEGVYSFGKGTHIYIDVPLRNPKKDKDITDEKELAERRHKGIVLHLKAEDDTDGKVKVKLGKKD